MDATSVAHPSVIHRAAQWTLDDLGVSAQMRRLGAWARALVDTSHRPIAVSGEPGVGKRWLAERLRKIDGRDAPTVVHIDLLSSDEQQRIVRSWMTAEDGHGAPCCTVSDELDRCVARRQLHPDVRTLVGERVVALPPVRRRAVEDVRRYVEQLTMHLARAIPEAPRTVTDAACRCLLTYSWPGNIREMKSVIERALSLARGAAAVDVTHLPLDLRESGATGPATLAEVERIHIRQMVRRHGGNRTHAARVLGISRATLINKIRLYHLDV